MSAETDVWFEIEIKDGADLDYFLWKSIQHKIHQLENKLRDTCAITNERTPPYNYLMKIRFTLKPSCSMDKFLSGRAEAREMLTPKEFHASLTEAETQRWLGR